MNAIQYVYGKHIWIIAKPIAVLFLNLLCQTKQQNNYQISQSLLQPKTSIKGWSTIINKSIEV